MMLIGGLSGNFHPILSPSYSLSGEGFRIFLERCYPVRLRLVEASLDKLSNDLLPFHFSSFWTPNRL